MNTFAYHVYINDTNRRIIVETNDVNEAIYTLVGNTERGYECSVVCGFTGEIFVATNCEEPWITDEWALMINGWLMEQMWG